MARRGLREKIVHGLNPLPNVSEEELFDLVGIDLEPSTISPFVMKFELERGNPDWEKISLNPGESIPLRESEAFAFLSELQELGAVVVSDLHDEEELRNETLKGLRAAHKHYNNRSDNVLRSIRIARGITKDEMEDMKSAEPDWAYWRNSAIAKVLQDRIKSLRDPAKKRAASRKTEAAAAQE